MGLFKDKLVLRLTASKTPGGEMELKIDHMDGKFPYLLPFSCISLVGSQMTRLPAFHAHSLAHTMIDIIQGQHASYKETEAVHGFDLEVYRNRDFLLYNKFSPRLSEGQPATDPGRVQADTVHLLHNYVAAVHAGLPEAEQIKLVYFLLLTIGFYQQDVFPLLIRFNQQKLRKSIRNKKKLASTELDILNTMYHTWKNEVRFAPGSATFLEKVEAAKKFNSYVV